MVTTVICTKVSNLLLLVFVLLGKLRIFLLLKLLLGLYKQKRGIRLRMKILGVIIICESFYVMVMILRSGRSAREQMDDDEGIGFKLNFLGGLTCLYGSLPVISLTVIRDRSWLGSSMWFSTFPCSRSDIKGSVLPEERKS